MLELGGWGPLLALWIGGALHIGWLIRREDIDARRRKEGPQRRAA